MIKQKNSHIYKFEIFNHNNGKIVKHFVHNGNIKDDKLYAIKVENIEKNYDKRNISSNTFRMNNNNKSEKKENQKKKIYK